MRVDSDPQRGGVAAPARRPERPAPMMMMRPRWTLGDERELALLLAVALGRVRLERHGTGWRIRSPQADLLVHELRDVRLRDVLPDDRR